MRSRSNQEAFTLIELMTVVVIVGVLSTLAVVGYRKLILSSHTAEATQMVQSIRVAQEGYHAETGSYGDISSSFVVNGSGSGLYPLTVPTTKKTAWGAACGGACKTNKDWSQLPLHVDGPVMYSYSTVAGAAGTDPTASAPAPSINGTTMTWPTSPTSDWFVVSAVGDVNGNSTFSTVVGSSFTNDVFVDNDGE